MKEVHASSPHSCGSGQKARKRLKAPRPSSAEDGCQSGFLPLAQGPQSQPTALERCVRERTAELQQTNARLQREIEKLRESEERLNLAADAAGVGLWSLNLGTGCFWLTGKTRELFSLPADEALTLERFLALIHPEDRELVRETILTVARSRQEGQVEYRAVQPDGSLRWMLSRGRVRCGTAAQPDCLMGVTLDITERKQRAEALERIRWLHAETEKIGKVGGWTFDIDTGQQTWTEETYRIHEQDLSHQPTVEEGFNFYAPDSRPVFQRVVRRAIEQGEPYDVELEIITAKGNRRTVHAIGKPDLEHRRVYGFFQDISEAKRASEALRQSEEHYRLLFEKMHSGIIVLEVILDPAGNAVDHRLVQANTEFEAQTGLRRSEELGKTSAELSFQWPDDVRKQYYQVALGAPAIHWERFNESLQRFFDVRVFSPHPGQFAVLFHDISARKQAEEALRSSEERLDLAFRGAQDGVWDWNMETDEVFYSLPWKTMLGYDESEIEPHIRAWKRLLHPDDLPRAIQAVNDVLAGTRDYVIECRMRHKDGHYVDVLSRGFPVRRGDRLVRLVGTHFDLTERKLAEQANRNADAFMVAVFNSIPGLLYLYTEDGRLVRWNRQHEEMTGYTPEELLNFPIQDWFAPEEQAKLSKEFSKVFTEGQTMVEMNLRLKNGERVPYSFTGTKVMIDGKPHLVGIGIDISKRRLEEEQVRQLSQAVEQSPVLVVITDTEGKITYVNRKFAELTGYDSSEVIGQNPRLLKSGENSPAFYRDLWATIVLGRTWHGEFHNRKKNGELYWERAVIAPVMDQTGKITHFVAIKEDITEHKRDEEELRASQALQRQAELEVVELRNNLLHMARVNTLGTLSGSLAHELNQPLGIILCNAEAAQSLLAQQPPDLAEVLDILKDIVAADQRAGEVIERLRSLLKQGRISLQQLSVNEVVNDMLRLLHTDLIARGVSALPELVPDLPLVAGDRVQLQQVLLNLILNAAEAMAGNAPGARRLHIQTIFREGRVCVSVRDEGKGLPRNLERLFQPFYTTKSQGLGMGLAICRSIIDAHHGRLWAEPHPEVGAVFRFELPVADSPDQP